MADNLTTATIDVRANTRGLEKDILKALKTVEFSEINTKKSSQALGRITGQVSEFNKSLEASNARVIAFGASAGAIFAVEKAFSSLISSTIQVEKKLTDINVLLGLSASTLQKFGDSLFGVAKNTAQSFSDVADAATELARQGLGIEETLKRTNAALILTRLSGLDAKSSVEALTATLNSFSGSALDAVEVVNKLANVDAAFAVSSADLANAISRVGSTAVDAGVSLDELIALVTSAQQTTARGGAVIGNSFKTIFTRLQRGKVQSLLESLGVDTSEGQSAISMLQQLATTYDTLGAAQKSYVAEQVGGVFQINILKAALSDLGKEYSIYGRALDTSLSSTDQAIRRNELLNKTVSALSTQAYANLEQAASKIGSLVFEPNAKGFLSGFNDLLSSFNNIDMESAGGKLMTGFFKGIGDFIGGPGAILATAVLVKLFSRLTQFAAGSAKELLGTNKAAQQQAAIEQSILSILQKNSQFTSQILSGKMTTVQAEKELLNYLTAQSNILREQEKLSKVIGANLRMAGVSVGASGVPMVAAAGKGKKAAASGYMPNFAADQAIGQAMENAGAKEHGYKAGKARKTRIHDGNGKSFTSFVNNKEDVKTFTNAAGKKATIVHPPNGFGENTQYAAGGFVPNFAVKQKKYTIPAGTVKKKKTGKDSQTSQIADANLDTHPAVVYDVIRAGTQDSFYRKFYNQVSNLGNGNDKEKSFALDYFKKSGIPLYQIKVLQENASKFNPSDLKKNVNIADRVPLLKPDKENPDKTVPFSYQLDRVRNNVLGKSRYEKFASAKTGMSLTPANARMDLHDHKNNKFGEVKFGRLEEDNLLAKAISQTGVTSGMEHPFYKDGKKETIPVRSGFKLIIPQETKDKNIAAAGFIPNFAYKFKKYGSEDPIREILDEKTRSFLTYADGKSDKGSPYLDMVGIHSAEKGQGLKLFSKLGKIAKRSGRKIRSSTIVPQLERLQSLDPNADLEKVLKAAYPQLLYRQRSGVKNTEFDFEYTQDSGKGIEKTLSGSNPFSLMLKSLVENGVNAKSLRENIFSRRVSVSSVEDSFAKGFVPNFASMKASDTMTRMVMEKFYPIKDATKFKEEYAKQSFKPAALKALYRERVEGSAPSTDLSNRAAAANKITSDETARAKVKDLGNIDYTMIHATEGSKPLSSEVASYKKKDKKTGEETRYIASLSSASLDNKKLNNASVQQRVGDALVDESNKLSAIFNPSGGAPFSDYKQLSNSGSVMSAAGTVFESAVRQAFKVPAQGQTARIDFPNPSSQLRSFFHNAPGDYEAKISNSPDNLSSALSKYIAVNGLAEGYIPNFAKSSGLSFSKSRKDEFGYSGIHAILGGKSIGSLSYSEDKRGEVEIGDFTVDKNQRGKGYGTELYKEAIKRNKGKKMKGQLLPQMNRVLEKIKKGEPVSAETLYPQIKRADLAKSSVFEVLGHKGMQTEKMTRDQFSSFVNTKINELKKDPKKLQSYFGNIEADEYGGLGVDLQTQHASGFVPNFLDVTKGKLPIGVRGRTNYGSEGSKTNIQLGVGAEESTLAHELFHSAYSRSTFDKAKSNDKIGKFISSPRKYAGSGPLIGDQVFKNLNKNNLIKSVGLNPVQLDFDGKNPSASYSGERAIDEIITRVQEKIFKNKGNLETLSVDEKTFAENLQQLGIISNKRLSNVSRHSKEGSKFRSLVENKFSSIASSSGFVPNFASQSLISEINKRILNPNVAQKLKEGQGLKDEAYTKAASRLGVNTSGLENFIASMGFPLKGKESINKVSSALGFGFGRSFAIDALKMGDWDYVKSSFEKNGLNKSDFNKLSQFAKTPKGESAFKWGFKSKAGGFVPNFANITSSTKDVRKKAHANQSSLNTFKIVHPLNPKIDAQGRVSFPDLEKIKGSAKIIHNEGMEGQNVFNNVSSFLDFVNSRGNKQTFFRRNSFDYVLSSAGYVPNFADALNSAISRERAAGLSKSQIYVDQHSSLKNKNNPMGLMVANTRDEPMGGIQGIKRARKEGRNPKGYGSSYAGYVPNFAGKIPGPPVPDPAGLASKNSIDKIEKILASFESEAAGTYGKEEFTKAWGDALDIALAKASSGAESVGKAVTSSAAVASPVSSGGRNGPLANDADLNAAANEAEKAVAVAHKKKAQVVNKSIETENKSIEANNKLIQAVEKDVQATSASTAAKGKGGKLNKVKGFVGRNSMGLGFGLQTAAGMVGEIAGNDDTQSGRTTKAVAGGVGDIASFMGTGAMIAGPWGAAAGAAVGLGKAAIDITKALTTKVPDLEKALQTSSDSMNRFGESGQKILQLNEQYADALNSGGDPAKAADIMAKTQQAYAEELSKLTDSQRASMISAVAQGKGQEEYAKILKQLSDKVKGDEGATALAKFREDDSESLRGLTGGYMGQGDKKMLKGLDFDFASMFSKNLDDTEIRNAIDIYSSKGPGKDTEYGKEQSALSVLGRLASSEKNSEDEKASFDNILKEFKETAGETDSSEISEGIIKALEKILKGRSDAKENAKAVEENTKNRKNKELQEIALKEAANARLLKIQAETESVFKKFNDGLDDFIGALEAGSKMREAAGNFKAESLEQSGANSYIVDKEKEKNLVSSNQDSLAVADLRNKQDSFNQFNAAINDMLSGITAESAKLGYMQTDEEQQAKLNDTKLSLQSQLAGASAQVFAGDTEGAKASVDKVFENMTPEQKSQIDPSVFVKGIQELKNVADQSNKNSKDLVNNSRRDLGIQAQQLIFQKAMSKLNQAQNYGGAGIKDIIKDDPENSFNKAISALNDAKVLGYNQKDLKQGKENAVKGAWQGKEKTTWGINGEKPNPAMSGAIIDFYKAAGEIGGESVISTESKDFGALAQAVSEQIRKKLNELKSAGEGVVDPAVFTRMESNLQGLGGQDKVAQLKVMKELGYANVSGVKIRDEALGGYTAGAFEGLDPALKKAFESTSDEGAGNSILLLAGQQKQTDSLLTGMQDVTANATLETNSLLSQQPQAIADALSTILEKGRKQNEKDNLDLSSFNLGNEIEGLNKGIESDSKKMSKAQDEGFVLEAKIAEWKDKSGFDGKKNNNEKMLEENSPEMQEAKRITQKSKNEYMKGEGGVKGGFKYDAAKELIEMGENFKNFKAKKDEVTKYDASIKSQEEKKKKAEGDKSTIDTKSKDLATAIAKTGPSAVPPSSSGQVSALPSSIKKGVEDGLQSGKESFGVGSPTEKQLDAIKKSSSNYKITSRDGVKRTVEGDAMYEAGVSPVNQKNLDKDTRLNRLHKAFQDIDGKNALPSYNNFKDVYSDLAGGEKEGREMYGKKQAEKLGGYASPDEEALLKIFPKHILDQRVATGTDKSLVAGQADAVKKGIEEASNKSSSKDKEPGLNFVDWGKKEGKIPQDFQLTKEMKTGQQALPENIAKAKKEFLSSFGAQTKGGGAIASTTTGKSTAISAVNRTEADEANRKMFAKQDAAIEAIKPTLTGSRMTPDGKGGFKNVAAPGTPEESLRLAEYETAKKNATYEKYNFANKQAAGPVSETGAAIQGGTDKSLVAGQADAVKKGIEEAANGSASKDKGAEKKSGLGFIDWAKKEGKISQDFQLTKGMKTGEQSLPEDVAKAKKEFLSSFGAQTKDGGAIASTTTGKSTAISAVNRTEADEANRKMFAKQDAAIEAIKPTLTGSRMTPDGKGGFKNVAAPGTPEESLRLAEYETAKKNATYEKYNFANKQAAGPVSETGAAIQNKSGSAQPSGTGAQTTASSPAQAVAPKLAEEVTSSMTRKIKSEDDKGSSPEQDPSQQILNSILASVNQIAQQIASTQEQGQQPDQGAVGGTAGSPQSASSGGGSAGGVSVSTPVSLTVNTSAAQGTDAATAIAEQIKTGLSSFLSSSEFISKVTSIANQAAGKVTPPTPPPK